jgi:hypothetical protein
MVTTLIESDRRAMDVEYWAGRAKSLPDLRASKVRNARIAIEAGRFDRAALLDHILLPLAEDLGRIGTLFLKPGP